MGRGGPLVAIIVALAGCSIVVDSSGLSGGAGDASVGTALLPDGGPRTSAPANDSGSGPTCIPGATSLCADFDQGSDVKSGFDDLRLQSLANSDGDGSKVITLTSEVSSSAPRAVRISLKGGGGQSCKFAQLTRDVKGTWKRAELSFDVLREEAPLRNDYLAGIALGPCAAYVAPFGTEPKIRREDDHSGSPDEQLAMGIASPPTGKFVRVKLVFDVRGTPLVEATIDGVPAKTLEGGPAHCTGGGNLWAAIGPHCVPGPLTLFYDNVELRFSE